MACRMRRSAAFLCAQAGVDPVSSLLAHEQKKACSNASKFLWLGCIAVHSSKWPAAKRRQFPWLAATRPHIHM